MTRLHLPLAVLSIAAVCVSCSSSSSPPNAYITSTLGSNPSATGGARCNDDSPNLPFITVGTENVPVSDGTTSKVTRESTSGPEAVGVVCMVHSTGGTGYDINLEVQLGPNGGVGGIIISGSVSDTTGAQPNINASFNDAMVGEYTANDCTIELNADQSPPITSGRIWGTITCPDASGQGYSCLAQATFIFQNCAQ